MKTHWKAVLASCVALLILLGLAVGRWWFSSLPEREEKAIRRDESGILKMIKLRGLRDVSYVRVHYVKLKFPSGPLEAEGYLELVPSQDAAAIARLLSMFSSARGATGVACLPGATARIAIGRRGAQPVGVSCHDDYLTDSRGQIAFFTCRGLERWVDARIADPTLRQRNAHLVLPPVQAVRADFAGGSVLQLDVARFGSSTDARRIRALAAELLVPVDPRDLHNLHNLNSGEGVKDRIEPTPTERGPAVYVRFVRPFEIEAVDMFPVPEAEAMVKGMVFAYKLHEDRLVVRQMAIWGSADGESLWIALIPEDGVPWYATWYTRPFSQYPEGRGREPESPVDIYKKLADQLNKCAH